MTGPIDQPEPQSPETESDSSVPETVGELLCTQRSALGRDIAFVAEHLRIRAAYIRAIEEGRYTDLPGSTYAIGFVRSYAEFLGLDAAETVSRFKEETAGGLHSKPELSFPSPVSEGRIPGGAILFLGLILAGLVYGTWYYMSSRDVSIAELVPALPERMQALIGLGNTEPPLAEGPIIAPGKTEPAKPEASRIEPAKTEPAPAAKVESAKPEASKIEPAKIDSTSAVKLEPGKAEAMPPAKIEPAVAAIDQAVPPDEDEDAPKPVHPVASPLAPTDHPQPLDNGKTYGAYNTASRVTIRAHDNAWVEIHDKGKKIWAQNLRKGDIYRVPNKDSLTLMTGSAGALDVFVDGHQVPSLGQMGTVRRGILLDPDKLQAGQ